MPETTPKNSRDISDCLQHRFAARGICFGCGPLNEQGLQVKSFVEGDLVVASFVPLEHHQGFPGMLSGGIIGTLFDCHMNWTAAWHLMQAANSELPPCTVTGGFGVEFKAPTPFDRPLRLEARLVELGQRKAKIRVCLKDDDEVTATGEGTFIAVKEGHPAFGKWNQ